MTAEVSTVAQEKKYRTTSLVVAMMTCKYLRKQGRPYLSIHWLTDDRPAVGASIKDDDMTYIRQLVPRMDCHEGYSLPPPPNPMTITSAVPASDNFSPPSTTTSFPTSATSSSPAVIPVGGRLRTSRARREDVDEVQWLQEPLQRGLVQ